MFSKIKVQANSLEEAFDWVEENLDDIPLGDNTDYIDGSYMIAADSADECTIYN